jgi:hypothetical protein
MIQPSGCTAKKKLSLWKFSYEYLPAGRQVGAEQTSDAMAGYF